MTLARLEITTWQPASKRSPSHLPRLRPNPYPSRAAPLILPRPRNIPALPNEIIAQILESLGEETYDPATGMYEQEDESAYDYLETCCLVSHAFLHKAREIMHREVVLYGGDHSGGHYKIIYDRLIRFPHLAARVRQLHLRHASGEWFPDTKALFGVCTAVEEVNFFCVESADLVRYIEAVDGASAKLKRVSIIGGGRSSDEELSAGLAFSSFLRSQLGLKSLSFQGNFDWVGDAPTFELEELKIADAKYTESGFEKLTRSYRSSLQHLALLENKYLMRPERNLAHFVPDFSLFTNLHTLHILDPPKDLTVVYPHLESLPLRHLYITE
ncbi:hypothetical protein RQP46_001880 [Phenoliferia psychrophenolica]